MQVYLSCSLNNGVDLIGDFCCHGTGTINEVTIRDLKPETSYEVQLSAINGKGEGESSSAESFKTEPVSKWSNVQLISFTPNLLPVMSWSRMLYSNPVLREKNHSTVTSANILLQL